MPAYTVLLFGIQARLVGAHAIQVQAPEGPLTADQILHQLHDAAPAIRDSLPASRIAVDHRFAKPGDPIDPASEIALIGMIGGG